MKCVRPKPRTKYIGVYAIRHVASGRMYIGGSTDITGRRTHHRFTLRRGTHKTKALQELWDAHGESAFEFVTLEHCSAEDLLLREDHWIKTTPDCLNTVNGAVTGYFAGPSPAKKKAAVRRWANPDYRAKRKAWLESRNQGRFTKKDPNQS
jgi:group I intron endonuclease